MQVSVRSYLTAGVAVLGAGAVALSPVQPIAAQSALAPAATQAIAVNLAASIDPITPIITTIQTTFNNVAALLGNWVQTPFPIAQTVIQNWLYYLNELPNIGAIVGQIASNIPNAIQAPFSPGPISDVPPDDVNPYPVGSAIGENISLLPLTPAEDGFGYSQKFIYDGIAQFKPAFFLANQTLLNFLNTPISGVLLGLAGPVLAPIVALSNSITGAIAALRTQDWGTAINDVINIPTTMINAFLNGGVNLDLSGAFGTLPAGVTAVGLNLGGLLTTFTQTLEDGFEPPIPVGTTQVGGVGFDSLSMNATLYPLGPDGPALVLNDPGMPIGLLGGLVSLSRYVARGISQVPTVSTAAVRRPVRGAAAAVAASAATAKPAAAKAAGKARSAAAARHAK